MSKEIKPTFSLTPSNLAEALEFSKLISESDITPRDYKNKPGNVLVAVAMGAEIGLAPLAALQSIAVINGRPSVWGDAMLALIRASPNFESIDEQQTDQEAVCTVKRRGEPSRTVVFTCEDAKRAKLWNKEGPWQQYPKRMLQMRARAFALRDTFPDILKGLAIREEAQDLPDHSRDIEGTAVSTDDLNARLAARLPKLPPDAPPKGQLTLTYVLEKIATAQSKAELEGIGPLAKALPEADRDAARQAYTERLKALAEPGSCETRV